MSQVRIYTPESSFKRPSVLFGEMYKDLLQGQNLARHLTLRDFRAQYRQSILGVFWIFILPLTNTITWMFLRGSGVISVAETSIPYPVYVFTGTMLWSIFTESIQSPLQKVMTNRSLLSKINFPREALILSSFYQSISNAGIKVLLMLVGMAALGYDFLNLPFSLFPIGVLALVLSGIAIGLVLTPIGLLYNDIGRGIPIIMQFLMYLSPVVFVVPKRGWLSGFIDHNPLTPLVVVSRSWMTGQASELVVEFVIVNVTLLILLFLGWIFFRVAMPILIEKISS